MSARAGRLFSFDGFAVYAVIYLTFIYLPVLFLPLFSFNDSIYVAFPLKGFTLEWYERMFNNPQLIASFFNSVKVASSVALTLGNGLPTTGGSSTANTSISKVSLAFFPFEVAVTVIVATPL